MSLERDAAAYRECTRDPIFLLQVRRYRLLGVPEGHEMDDEGDVWAKSPIGPAEPDRLTVDDLLSFEAAVAWWETESVYLTREEAEAYGQRRAYNYRDGWRVYCVCAEGRLGDLLRAHG